MLVDIFTGLGREEEEGNVCLDYYNIHNIVLRVYCVCVYHLLQTKKSKNSKSTMLYLLFFHPNIYCETVTILYFSFKLYLLFNIKLFFKQ